MNPSEREKWVVVAQFTAFASQVVKDTGISGEDLWEITRKVKTKAFLDYNH